MPDTGQDAHITVDRHWAKQDSLTIDARTVVGFDTKEKRPVPDTTLVIQATLDNTPASDLIADDQGVSDSRIVEPRVDTERAVDERTAVSPSVIEDPRSSVNERCRSGLSLIVNMASSVGMNHGARVYH